jgi:hypothetical protein
MMKKKYFVVTFGRSISLWIIWNTISLLLFYDKSELKKRDKSAIDKSFRLYNYLE